MPIASADYPSITAEILVEELSKFLADELDEQYAGN